MGKPILTQDAEHFRCTMLDFHALLMENFHIKTTAHASLFVFFRIKGGNFPYRGGDDVIAPWPNNNHT